MNKIIIAFALLLFSCTKEEIKPIPDIDGNYIGTLDLRGSKMTIYIDIISVNGINDAPSS